MMIKIIVNDNSYYSTNYFAHKILSKISKFYKGKNVLLYKEEYDPGVDFQSKVALRDIENNDAVVTAYIEELSNELRIVAHKYEHFFKSFIIKHFADILSDLVNDSKKIEISLE